MTDTETLDRLYLEWSQFTKAKIKRELEAETEIERLRVEVSTVTQHRNRAVSENERLVNALSALVADVHQYAEKFDGWQSMIKAKALLVQYE